MKKGFIRQKGHYIDGAVDFETGTLTSLLLPEPTAAHVLANKEQSTEERINAIKLILDFENSHCTKGHAMAMEIARSMKDHPINVVRQLVIENFTPTPLKVTNQKSVP